MLKIVEHICELSFSELMNVYLEGNQENGRERYPQDTDNAQLRKAESDFYEYLTGVFFRQNDSCYAIWEEDGRYRAALRLEPYSDGYLICALETAPEMRRRGYATLLVRHVQKYLSHIGSGVMYSHVSKRNTPSMATHRKCGFRIIKDYAVYSDGSVLHSSCTLAYEYKKSEI